MKKLIFLSFFFCSITYAQFGSPQSLRAFVPFQNAGYNFQRSIENRDAITGCGTSLRTYLDLDRILKSSRNYSWNDYYYEIEIVLYGKNVDTWYEIIHTKKFDIGGEYIFVNGNYRYQLVIDLTNTEYSSYTEFDIRPRIIKYTFNNDPGFSQYFPTSTYHYLSQFLDKCYVRDNDRDNDGIVNAEDDCPDDPGPSSNNGCPLPINTPEYDLSLSSSDIFTYSSCFDCSNPLSVLGSKKHILYANNSIQVQFTVRNKGEGASDPVKIRFYMSENKDSQFGVQANDKVVSLPSIAPEGSFITNPSFTYNNDFPVDLGSYYLVIYIEPGSKDKDTGNNYKSIPVKVEEFGTSPILYTQTLSSSAGSFNVSIFDISGLLVAQKNVATKEEEDVIVQSLPKGFYIVKNGVDTYKIVKD